MTRSEEVSADWGIIMYMAAFDKQIKIEQFDLLVLIILIHQYYELLIDIMSSSCFHVE